MDNICLLYRIDKDSNMLVVCIDRAECCSREAYFDTIEKYAIQGYSIKRE